MGVRNLREAAEAADVERFGGRDAELARIRDLLDPATPSRILYVHGPGGIGKSALLRAAGRMAQNAGLPVAAFDGRTLPGDLGRLIEQVASAEHAGAPRLVVLDEADVLGSALAPLRDALLDRLGDESRIVLAGRSEPDPSWRAHGLPGIVAELPLGPLDDADALRLLAASGLDRNRHATVLAWAQGSPLALTVAAAVPAGEAGQPEAALEARLTGWLAGRTILDVDPAILEVLALVRAADARLLAAALPGRSTRGAMAQLAALPVVQRLGARLALHPVLAAAIRARLRATAPQRYRELVRRIALHLGASARLGDIDALIELSLLVEDPAYRQAISNRPSATHYADAIRAGELIAFSRAEGFDTQPDWPELASWEPRAWDIEFALRRSDGAPLLLSRFARLDRLPQLGPVTTSLRGAAERSGLDPARAFAGICLFADAPEHDLAEAARLSTGAFMHRSGMPMLDGILIHFPAPDRKPGSTATLGRDVPGAGSRAVALSDFRPGGAVAFVEAIVLREQGYAPPAGANAALLAPGHIPEREALLRAALDRVFDASPADRRLRDVIELAHLGPRRTERECLEALHVSRPTWYRLLRTARERVLAAPAG